MRCEPERSGDRGCHGRGRLRDERERERHALRRCRSCKEGMEGWRAAGRRASTRNPRGVNYGVGGRMNSRYGRLRTRPRSWSWSPDGRWETESLLDDTLVANPGLLNAGPQAGRQTDADGGRPARPGRVAPESSPVVGESAVPCRADGGDAGVVAHLRSRLRFPRVQGYRVELPHDRLSGGPTCSSGSVQ